jgi:hypothetical protein
MNHLFIIREARITELKKEIVRLGGTVTQQDIDAPHP